jgi:hypothetical protein
MENMILIAEGDKFVSKAVLKIFGCLTYNKLVI